MKTNKLSKADIDKVIAILDNEGIVAFPTDTVFGLACLCRENAVKKVYEAKGRDFNKPLPMMCTGGGMINIVACITESSAKLIDKFMPGPITIIFNKREQVDDFITGGKKTIGIRVPDDEWILKLMDKLQEPILVTSANISGNGSLLKWNDVYECMKDKIDAIVCEDARGDSASTIVDCSGDIKILREGPISKEEIMDAIK